MYAFSPLLAHASMPRERKAALLMFSMAYQFRTMMFHVQPCTLRQKLTPFHEPPWHSKCSTLIFNLAAFLIVGSGQSNQTVATQNSKRK